MGFVSTEQTVAIIEAVGDAIPEQPVMRSEPNMNFWPLLIIAVVAAIVPVFVTRWLKKRKK
jgi:hypothetical protein